MEFGRCRLPSFTAALQLILFLQVCLCQVAVSYNILFVTIYGSRSHVETFRPAVEALSRRSHNVTYLTVLPMANSYDNVTVHHLSTLYDFLKAEKANLFDVNMKHAELGRILRFSYVVTVEACSAFLSDPSFLKIVADKSTSYDVVIMDPVFSECGLVLIHLLGNPPLIYYCTTQLYTWIALSLGIPTPIVYIPSIFSRAPNLKNFGGRLVNAYHHYRGTMARNYMIMPAIEDIVRGIYPDMPPLGDIERNCSLVFANSDSSSLDLRKPTTANFIEVGGTHCRPPRPLSKDLEEFIEGAGEHGFIYLSFGTYVYDGEMTREKANVFLGAFRRLKQRVVWKVEANFTDLPPNVRLFSWLPQQDLLGHPKIKVFITQGGQLSAQEAVYHRVPTLGMAFIGDQYVNVVNMVEKGIGEELDYSTFKEQMLYDTLVKLMNDNSYKKNLERYSTLLRERPMTAIDVVTYWVEYVIRHKGADHLRLKYYNFPYFVFRFLLLDIIVSVLLSLVLVIFLVWMALKVCRAIVVKLSTASSAKLKKIL